MYAGVRNTRVLVGGVIASFSPLILLDTLWVPYSMLEHVRGRTPELA